VAAFAKVRTPVREGRWVFNARREEGRGARVILTRIETSPEDIKGMMR
jgi:hypothetical protein